jgi:hypothetical protein
MGALRNPASIAALLLAVGLLAGCGAAGGATATGGAKAGSGGSATGAGGCAQGAAGSGAAITAPEEPDAGVAAPSGACWKDITPTPMAQDENGALPAGDSASFAVAWSPKALYVLTQVRVPKVYTGGGSKWWNSDSTEYDFTTVAGQQAFSSSQDCHLALSADGTFHNLNSQCYFHTGPTAKVATTSDGYAAVAAVPWGALGVTAPRKGTQILFDIGQDIANATTRVAQPFWAGTPGGSPDWPKDAAGWGTLTLG